MLGKFKQFHKFISHKQHEKPVRKCFITILTEFIRPIAEYACAVFFLEMSLSVCKHAMSAADHSSLADRRNAISAQLFAEVISNQEQKFRHLLPPPNTCAKNLRCAHKFQMPTDMFISV